MAELNCKDAKQILLKMFFPEQQYINKDVFVCIIFDIIKKLCNLKQ